VTILHIHQEGAPILREVARPIQIFDEALARLAQDMLETMERARGIGIAAPQVGHSIGLIVLKATPWALCNPIIESADGSQDSVEGCLSVPTSRWGRTIVRPQKLCVRYHDLLGAPGRVRAKGVLASMLAHEIDHLNGVLFVDYAIVKAAGR
jgi:peptide deformylase